MTTKTCKACGIEKPLEDFHRHPKATQGRQPSCKTCHNAASKARYASYGPERRAALLAKAKFNKYGITVEAVQEMLAEQGSLCCLCGQPERTMRKRSSTNGLTMDHDHKTKKPRRLLCSDCNLALGHASDDPALLRRMADYVEEFR